MTFTYPSHTTKGCVPLSSDVMLTELMLHYGIGIRSVQTFETYEIDADFFEIE